MDRQPEKSVVSRTHHHRTILRCVWLPRLTCICNKVRFGSSGANKTFKKKEVLRASLSAIAMGQVMVEQQAKINFPVVFLDDNDAVSRRHSYQQHASRNRSNRIEKENSVCRTKNSVRLLREYSNPARLKSDAGLSENRTEIRFAKPPYCDTHTHTHTHTHTPRR